MLLAGVGTGAGVGCGVGIGTTGVAGVSDASTTIAGNPFADTYAA